MNREELSGELRQYLIESLDAHSERKIQPFFCFEGNFSSKCDPTTAFKVTNPHH
jgi:hypothetical protein